MNVLMSVGVCGAPAQYHQASLAGCPAAGPEWRQLAKPFDSELQGQSYA